LLLNAPFLGIGYSLVTTATISLMPTVFFPDYVDHYKLNIASFNLGFVAVGAGALIGPWIVLAIERWWGYRQGLLYFGVALIAPAALTALSDREQFPVAPETTATWQEVFVQPPMIMLVAVILLYFAIENCLEFWPESYLKELGFEGAGLTVSMLVFWLAFIATRAAAAWALYEFAHYPHFAFGLTIVLVLVSALILGNLSGGFDMGSGALWFWLLGACYGPILPGLLGMALELYPKPIPISILGALLALSGLDTLVMRPLMSRLGMNRPARSVMWAPAILALIMAAPLLLLAFLRI
jgi:MFS family permease